MFSTIRFVIGTVFFLVIFGYALAPALSQVTDALQGLMISDGAATGVIGRMETVLFLGMPLVMLAGVMVIGFVVATGLRGTSR